MTFEEAWTNSTHITPLIYKEEGEALWNAVMDLHEGSVVCEIGSYVGKSSFILANACMERKSRLICIDPFIVGFDGIVKYDNTRDIFKKNILDVFDNVKLYDMTSEKAAKYIKDIDFLFIDGDHDYEGVVLDIKKYTPKLKNGGLVSFHDYNNSGLPSVKQAIEELLPNWSVVNNVFSVHTRRKPYGVKQAI